VVQLVVQHACVLTAQ
jgi:hypothetical protein